MPFTRKTTALLIISLFLITSTSACSENSQIKKEHVGTIMGAFGGAFAGSTMGKGKGKTLAIATGTLLGATLGKSIGASLDRADIAYYNTHAQNTLEKVPSGETRKWRNPDSGNGGSFTPLRTYEVAPGNYCREYTQTIYVGGRTAEGFGTACRQPDGTWKIQQ